jgi:hypothetical protein
VKKKQKKKKQQKKFSGKRKDQRTLSEIIILQMVLNNNKTRLAARISIARLMKSTRARRADDSLPRLLAFFPSTQSKDGLAISFFSFIIIMFFLCALFFLCRHEERFSKKTGNYRKRKERLPPRCIVGVGCPCFSRRAPNVCFSFGFKKR